MSQHRVVIAGCGGMANTWVKYAMQRPDVEIVGLIDINEDNAKKLQQEHGFSAPFFTDIKQAAEQVDANLVFDVTIPAVHKQITMAAFESGWNVMGEKPIADSLADAYEVVQEAKEKNRFYAVMQNRRFNKNIRSYRDLVAKGTVGKPGFITADFFIGAHFGGFRDAMESPLILDMAIHTFDQARFISGADPVSVYCHEFNPSGSWYEGNASAVCVFEMSDGSVFNYRGSWSAEGARTSWESSWRVIGNKGTAVWDGTNIPYAEVVRPTEEKLFLNEYDRVDAVLPDMTNEGHFGCLDEMFDALATGRKAETDCTDNIKSMEMVFGALESAAQKKKIDLV